MQLLTRLIALTRAAQLRRQLREVNQTIDSLVPGSRVQLAALCTREFTRASKCEFPHLYATPPETKYRPWGSGTDIAIERLRSDNVQVRLRGIALWLVVAYHETQDAPFGEQKELHRLVMRSLRTLKDSAPAEESNGVVAIQAA
ncbi:MAG: hypothetical protein WBV61_05000 [Rhodanobacteraceae bacterium]